MPQQEVFLDQETGGIQIEVVKTYDQQFAREAFNSIDEAAQLYLWNSLKIAKSYKPSEFPPDHDPNSSEFLWEELADAAREGGSLLSFFVVKETKATHSRYLYVSSEWPTAEAFALNCTKMNAIETQTFECLNIECGAVFSYRRVSCGHFVQPAFCPTCGEPMEGNAEASLDRSSTSDRD